MAPAGKLIPISLGLALYGLPRDSVCSILDSVWLRGARQVVGKFLFLYQ